MKRKIIKYFLSRIRNKINKLIISNSYLNALVSFVSYAQLLGDLVVVSGNHSQLLLNLGLAAGQIDVDDCELVNTGLRLFEGLFNSALGAEGLEEIYNIYYISILESSNDNINFNFSVANLFVIATNFFNLASERLNSALSDTILIKGYLQLSLDLIVVTLDLSELKKIIMH